MNNLLFKSILFVIICLPVAAEIFHKPVHSSPIIIDDCKKTPFVCDEKSCNLLGKGCFSDSAGIRS